MTPFRYEFLRDIDRFFTKRSINIFNFLSDFHYWLNWKDFEEPVHLTWKKEIAVEYKLDYEKLKPIKWGKNDYLNQNAIWFYNDKGKFRYFNYERELGETEELTEEIYNNSLTDKEKEWRTFHTLTMWASNDLPCLLADYTEMPDVAKKKIKDFLLETINKL